MGEAATTCVRREFASVQDFACLERADIAWREGQDGHGRPRGGDELYLEGSAIRIAVDDRTDITDLELIVGNVTREYYQIEFLKHDTPSRSGGIGGDKMRALGASFDDPDGRQGTLIKERAGRRLDLLLGVVTLVRQFQNTLD